MIVNSPEFWRIEYRNMTIEGGGNPDYKFCRVVKRNNHRFGFYSTVELAKKNIDLYHDGYFYAPQE